jgi:hypothetical protein
MRDRETAIICDFSVTPFHWRALFREILQAFRLVISVAAFFETVPMRFSRLDINRCL